MLALLLLHYLSHPFPNVFLFLPLSPLQDCGIIPHLLTADEVVKILVQDQPLAVDLQDYNLEMKVWDLSWLYSWSGVYSIYNVLQAHVQVIIVLRTCNAALNAE